MLIFVGSGRALGTVWLIRPGVELIVGRKGAPLLVERDSSVSRKHATLYLAPNAPTRVTLTDDGSKFGVHINGRRCSAHAESIVSIGDMVTFGGQGSTFELRECHVAFCIANVHSGMESLVDSVHAEADALGISVVESVEMCTHLLVPQLEVTRRLVHGLASSCWIASLDYIQCIKAHPLTHMVTDPTVACISEYIQTLQYMPVPQTPEISTDSPIDLRGVTWLPDRRRQRLFNERLFVFADTTQHDKYMPIIKAAGGTCVMIPGVEESIQSTHCDAPKPEMQCQTSAATLQKQAKEFSTSAHTLILHLIVPSAQSGGSDSAELESAKFVKGVANVIGVRPISESEISLAILFISCDDHTNPAVRAAAATEERLPGEDQPETTDSGKVPGQIRRRKPARISGFWASAVEGKTLEQSNGVEATKVVVSPKSQPTSHYVPENSKSSTRRRRKMEDFWSSATHSTPAQPVTVDVPSEMATEPDSTVLVEGTEPDQVPANANDDQVDSPVPKATLSTSENVDSECDADMQPGSKLLSRVVSLLKPKTSLAPCASTDFDKPNFKRFKKTVHPYQLV